MIITISGRPGSGKSTVSKLVAKKLSLKHYSIGDFMRQIAESKNMTLLELSKQAEKDEKIDEELDEKQRSLALNENYFVIDARLGFYFIPFSFKVFLYVSKEEAAKRIAKRENISYEDALKQSTIRIKSEHKRYKKTYNVDYEKEKHFDLIIDTDNKTPKEICDLIVNTAKSL
jgi:CMP/dCMP kinase